MVNTYLDILFSHSAQFCLRFKVRFKHNFLESTIFKQTEKFSTKTYWDKLPQSEMVVYPMHDNE